MSNDKLLIATGRANPAGLSKGARLALAIVRACPGGISQENAYALCEQLVRKYGSPGAALKAIRQGVVSFELDEQVS
jgi:hypothetical protein